MDIIAIGLTGHPVDTFRAFQGEVQITPMSVRTIMGADGKLSVYEQPSIVFWREGDVAALKGQTYIVVTRGGDRVVLLQGAIIWNRQPRQTLSGIEFYVMPAGTM